MPKAKKSSGNKVETKKPNYLLRFFGFWAVIFVLVLIAVFAFKLDPMAILVFFVVVAISFVFTIYQLLQQWEGTVAEIKTIAEKRQHNKNWVTENVTYAFIKQNDGKTKKVRSGGWKVGDCLKKEKWDMNVKVL